MKVYNNLKISELWLVSFDTVCKIVHLLLHAVCLCECHLFLISQGLFAFGIVTGSLVWETRGKQAVKCTINFYWLILKVLYRDWASFVSNTYTWVTDVMEILHYYKYYGKYEKLVLILFLLQHIFGIKTVGRNLSRKLISICLSFSEDILLMLYCFFPFDQFFGFAVFIAMFPLLYTVEEEMKMLW